MARQTVVRDRLPDRRVIRELTLLRTDAGVAVDGPQAHADVSARLRVAAVQRRAAVRAERLVEAAAARVPDLDELLALHDPERAVGCARVGGGSRARAALAAGAVAVVGRDERLGHLVSHASANATARDHRHVNITSYDVTHLANANGLSNGQPQDLHAVVAVLQPEGQHDLVLSGWERAQQGHDARGGRSTVTAPRAEEVRVRIDAEAERVRCHVHARRL